MNRTGKFLFLFFALISSCVAARAQTPQSYVSCIVYSATFCPYGAFSNTNLGGYPLISVAGYHQPGDGGGGTLTLQSGSCMPNGGSIIQDNARNCFSRINSTWSQKEFGAYSDGVTAHDDTTALQNWFNATQPHIAVPGNSIVSATLTCPSNATIQGPSNLAGQGTPVFVITATSAIFTGSSVIAADASCRISGVGIDANGRADAVDVLGTHVTIDGFSELKNGFPYDLKCNVGSGSVYGLQKKNVELDSAWTDGIHITGSCHDVRLIEDLVSGAGKSGSGSGISFAGGEGTISGGVIQESAGIGLDLAGADRVSVTAEHIQGNGRGASGGAGIRINNSNTIAISGNHLEGNGGFETGSAQILFAGTSDNINIGTNVYAP
ncbi:MAG TPA: right-handed parallel beta-helix repeat-containing protein [Rhizomicrobium sp.]